MDNAQKAIMIGVGLFITILIIAAVMLIVTPAINLLHGGAEKLNSLEASIIGQLTAQFDEQTVNGNQVIAAINQYYYDQDMILEVQAVKSGTIKDYGVIKGNGTVSVNKGLSYDDENERGKLSDLTNSSQSETYVPINARFDAHLIKNGDAVVGILFQRK